MKRFAISTLLLTFFLTFSIAQNHKVAVYGVAFYNLENLFDTINQPDVNDEEFTPNGSMKWSPLKYKNKLNNMARVLADLGSEYCPNGPAVIGVSEIENKSVLDDLVKTGNFGKRGYEVIHYDSPDYRGIDVGLLYNPKLFKPISSTSTRLYIPSSPRTRTRDQLAVTGEMDGEIVHFIVNHWPSRLGGRAKSSIKREAAAALSKHLADSLLAAYPGSKVMIMGDLNDDPADKSCSEVIGAKKNKEDVQPGGFYNPFWSILSKGVGTLAYQGNWNLFDQIIISSELLGKDRSTLKFWKAEVFNADYLKQQEGKYKSYPLRTHAGGVWLNGYSDHFPTIIYLAKVAE